MLDTICDVLKSAYESGWVSNRDGNASGDIGDIIMNKNENNMKINCSY